MGMHIGGLSSGNDYQSMVDQMMEVRKIPITALETKQSELDYDMGAWSDVQTLAQTMTDTLDDLRGFELWRDMSAESSYEGVATASADTAAAEQSYTLSVSKLAKAQNISSDSVDTTSDLITNGIAAEGDVFEIEGQEITIEADETLSSLRIKINSAALSMSDENRVRASIVNDHLVLTRENTGEGDVALSDTTGTVLENLGLVDDLGAIKNETVAGQNAEFTVNGISVVRSSNDKLEDVVEDLTINLKGVGTSTIEVQPDREAVKEKLVEFVDAYNALASAITGYSQIELGGSSELAMKGELYGDSLITSIRSNLRRQVTDVKSDTLDETNAAYSYNGNDGIMDNLSDIGIWTSGETNQISIVNEDLLDDMLEYEFENMEQLFKGVYSETDVAYTGGVAADLYKYANSLSESLTGGIAVKIETMTQRYDDYADKITDLESSLDNYEQQLWDQFTAMEDALANMESQSSYITSMFSSGK